MTLATVIDLDSRRPRVFEQMLCMFCFTEHALRHAVAPAIKYHGPCPGCDETASVPLPRFVAPEVTAHHVKQGRARAVDRQRAAWLPRVAPGCGSPSRGPSSEDLAGRRTPASQAGGEL